MGSGLENVFLRRSQDQCTRMFERNVNISIIGREALNWMKMDENLHASINQTASWWAEKESGAQWHCWRPPRATHGYFLKNAVAGLQEK